MPDLNSTAAIAASGSAAAGTVMITGSLFGMQFDALIVGFLAGLVALSFQDKQNYLRMASTLFSSSLLAGCFAPIWAATAVHYFSFLDGLGDQTLRVAGAAAIGVVAQTLVPVILERLKSFVANFTPPGTK